MSTTHVRTGKAAEMLGLNRKTVIIYIRSGDLEAYRIPNTRTVGVGEYRISIESIRRFIDKRK